MDYQGSFKEKQFINKGHTNISYLLNGNFVQEKIYTGFNHKIDYKILSIFDFVPKLINDDETKVEWEFIKGDEPKLSDENLIKIAKYLYTIHHSKLKFPPSNHAARVKKYRKILSEKNVNIKALNDFYRNVNKTLSNMRTDIPCHNDLWTSNLVLQDETEKLYICDWEYATMGDPLFELAYFIESANLSKEQEKVFLDAYGEYDELFLIRHKMLVNYLVILWVYSQDEKPFSTEMYEKRLYKYDKELSQLRGF
ncbi:phosphotransferase [Mycoplasmopsis bovis]|uniref:phosphotransferase n=1 Tax=Mycoplasmopsis bovis TaxID=28903 RepID=UPI0027AA22CF